MNNFPLKACLRPGFRRAMRRSVRVLLTMAAAIPWAPLAGLSANFSNELTQAKADLFLGRSYLAGFPESKTRNALRRDYLGMDNSGALTGGARLPRLRAALDRMVAVRRAADLARADDETAQIAAWESLEATLNGQLIAGNASLLRGLRPR